MPESDGGIAKAVRKRPASTLERHVLAAMPSETDVEKRIVR